MNQIIVTAIQGKRHLKFIYDNHPRIVEPHCHGLTVKKNLALRAFQVDGSSSTGEMGWKMYDVNKITALEILNTNFEIREGYSKGDKGMSLIYIEL